MMDCSTKIIDKAALDADLAHRKQLIASGQFNAPEVRKLPAYEAIKSITDRKMRTLVHDAAVKAVESYDLTGIRFVSYWDQMIEYANTQTVFSTLIGPNGIVRSTDFQVAWRETFTNDGRTAVEFFNLNAGLPSEAELDRAVVTNTMGAYGNMLNIRMIAQELHAQSPINPGDEYAQQLRAQLIAMSRFANSKRLANTEVTTEIVGDNPQWGGIVTRSTDNKTILAAGSDLTDALIQTQVTAIANPTSLDGLGFGVGLVCLTTATQVGKVKDLMIDRFPGENSGRYLDYQARLQALVPGANLPADMVQFYQPDVGRAVAFVVEPQLAAGTAFFFDPTLPRVAKFQMMGQYGPWAIERMSPELTRLFAVFDFESIIDPKKGSRATYLNVN